MNKIEKMKELKRKLFALSLAGTLLVTAGGCSNRKEQDKNSEIGFEVSDSTSIDNGLYPYVINREGLESQEYDFSGIHENVSFAKVVESEEYGTEFTNDRFPKFYTENLQIVVPDCYTNYEQDGKFGPNLLNNFDCSLKVEKIQELQGTEYTVVYSSMTAKRDLYYWYRNERSTDYKIFFKKGDNISSVAVYFRGELVAFKQYGAGSKCENVVNATVGDVELALSTVASMGLADKKEEISANELSKYQESLEKENVNKMMIKK